MNRNLSVHFGNQLLHCLVHVIVNTETTEVSLSVDQSYSHSRDVVPAVVVVMFVLNLIALLITDVRLVELHSDSFPGDEIHPQGVENPAHFLNFQVMHIRNLEFSLVWFLVIVVEHVQRILVVKFPILIQLLRNKTLL